MRRVEHMERNVRPRHDDAALQENRSGGRILPASFGLRGGMQIFIKTLTGKTITIDDIGSADTIETLKTKIRIKVHWVFTQNAEFYTIFNGLRLADHHSLNFYNIVAGITVWMVMRLRGGIDAGPHCNKSNRNQSFNI